MNGQNFRFFIDTELYPAIETVEWVGFDGYKNTVEQGKGRLGRDVTFGAEDGTLQFHQFFGGAPVTSYTLPNGETADLLSMGLPYILAELNAKGFEAVIKPRLQRNGVDFIIGQLETTLMKTDMVTYVECKVIQEGKRAELKRQSETKINLNSDKDINGNTITPIAYENILILPLPTEAKSEWKYGLVSPKSFTLNSGEHANFSNQQVSYGIRSTLSYIQGKGSADDFPYIEAADELRNIVINFSNVDIAVEAPSAGDLELKAIVYTPDESYILQFDIVPDADYIIDTIFEGESFNSTYSLSIPLVFRGQRIGIYVKAVGGNAEVVWTAMDIEITATTTAYPSVASGVRYVSIFDQLNVASGVDLPITAPRWREDGEFWGRLAIPALGMRGFTDKPFWCNWKDETDDLSEVNGDYQVCPEEIFIGLESDFYPDIKIGEYTQVPDRKIELGFNPKATVKTVKFAFENYAKDNLNSVHTVREYKTPNKIADNVLDIKVRHIVCPYRGEAIRRENIIFDQNAALPDDDNYYLLDTVPLPEGTEITQTAKLQQRVNPDTGFLEILNNTFSGYDATSPTFGWTSLGTSVGSPFNITMGTNTGAYVVESITQEVIALSGGSPVDASDLITFEYLITEATLVTRRMEGFDSITGASEELPNKAYTPARLLRKYYGSLLKTIGINYPTGQFNEPYFIGNGDVTIQETDYDPITENAPILVSELQDALLDQRTIKDKLVVDFESFKNICDEYNTIHEDGTIGGYMEVKDALGVVRKVYLTKGDELWRSGLFDLEGEIKAN